MSNDTPGARFEVEIDEELCVGAGNCVFLAPEVFDQREADGIVVLLQRFPPPDQHENVRKAARMCPSKAIRVEGE